ncbi:MAG: D-alanine--D-alanine ligase family protein [bacterium]
MRIGLTFNMRRASAHPEEDDPDLSLTTAPGMSGLDNFAEWDDEQTVNDLITTIGKYHEVIPIEANAGAYEKLRDTRPDLVFNIAEGYHGVSRESLIPAMLEMLRIPYTGSDPLTLGLCLDKSRAKEILKYHRVPTAKFSVLKAWPLNGQLRHMDYPMFVKPISEGSSKGIWMDALVNDRPALKKTVEKVWHTYNQPAIIEEFMPGREFTVAMLGNGATLRMLPIVEISFACLPADAPPVYSYEAKWLWDSADSQLEIYKCPAPVDDELQGKIEALCKKAFNVLGCRDLCRIDVRMDAEGEPNILELNPLPGLIKDPSVHSCYPKAAYTAGMTFDELIQSIISAACSRLGMAQN